MNTIDISIIVRATRKDGKFVEREVSLDLAKDIDVWPKVIKYITEQLTIHLTEGKKGSDDE